jgi:uncharacterized RDD family membrane protein YckC
MQQDVETNILQDIEQEIYLEPASVGARFANFLIDTIVYYGAFILVGAALGIAFQGSGEDFETSFLFREDLGSILLQYAVSISTFLAVFTVIEGSTKGKTLGKLITGTRARKINGEALSWKDAFMRSLCRLVPFEPFSAFGGFPWHDRWTNTIVTREKK